MDIDNSILNFILSRPFLTIVAYLAANVLIYGFSGIIGGFLPMKVKLSVGTFYTSRRNAYHSERLTRIVQWRFFGGADLPVNVRQEILSIYGPSKHYRHYKNVVVNEDYKPNK